MVKTLLRTVLTINNNQSPPYIPPVHQTGPRRKHLAAPTTQPQQHAGSPQQQSPQPCTVDYPATPPKAACCVSLTIIGLWALVLSHMYWFGSLSCYLLTHFPSPDHAQTNQYARDRTKCSHSMAVRHRRSGWCKHDSTRKRTHRHDQDAQNRTIPSQFGNVEYR